MACIDGAGPVLHQMRDLGGNQQGGLASFPDVASKGGWGPESDGGFLVRQVALVGNSSGKFGASLAAEPADGSFETAKGMLNALGAWLNHHRDDMPEVDADSG